MKIIYQDERLIAVEKPAGYFVHPPERSPFPPPREKICVYALAEKLGRPVFPVHRLDAATSGVMLFAFERDSTRRLADLFAGREVLKTYQAVARGYVDDEGVVELPLESKGQIVAAETRYRTIARIELSAAVGKRYATARYSLIEAVPRTGRWHQIRRHFDRISHPLLGDIDHGDSHHNRFFRDELRLPGLCLRAMSLEFKHPWSGLPLKLEAPFCGRWQRVRALFGLDSDCVKAEAHGLRS